MRGILMMTALLGAAIIWQPNDYIFFKKCGEITISPDVQNIGFNCLFCTGICLQTEIFLQHLQEQHKEEVFKLYEIQNSITLVDEQLSLAKNVNTEEIMKLNEMNLKENLFNTIFTTNNACISSNQLPNQALKENCINLYGILAPTSDHNSSYDGETNDLLALTSPNQDLENLITLNPHENLVNNLMTFNSNSSTLTSNSSSTLTVPSTCISGSAGVLKSLPDDNECEIGDGEDSGIMLVQSPYHSDCSGLNDCMLFAEGSSIKSTHNYNENRSCPSPENIEQLEIRTKYAESKNSFKGKYLKTPDMRKALRNKDIIKYLLEAYRKNEKLWNPKHPSYKYNAPRTIYKEFSQPLLNDKKYSLTGEEIFGILTELRGRYRRELKKFEVRKGKHKTRLWYFEKMQFLREVIEEKRKEREKEKCVTEPLVSKGNEAVTNRQILSYLLESFRKSECLWNPKHQDYGSCNKTVLYNRIAGQLKGRLNIHITQAECLHEIKKLRIRYCKELRSVHKLKGLYMPKLWCFDEMEFLRPIMEEKIMKNLKKINRTNSSLTKTKHDFKKAVEIKFINLEQQLNFIEIYRSFNSLWYVDHPDYRSTTYRKKALNEMLEIMNFTFKEQKKFKLEQLEKTLYLLRKDFSNEKHERLTKNDSSKDSKMSFVLYEKLSEFLATNLGPFICNNCQRICKTYDQYKIHRSKHDNTLPFICTLCGKGFQTPGNLTVHIRRHRRDLPYSCEICTKSFATSTEVNIHMRSHTGERPYACECCDKKFKTWSFYDLHRKTHLNQSNFHCPICEKLFYERNRFTDHMNIHLNIRKHQCDQCGKGFTTVGNLKKHLDLHAPVKKYECQPCGKSFSQFAGLKWHRKTQHEQ